MSKIHELADRVKVQTAELADMIAEAPPGEAKKPKASTTATAKYQDKAGLATRSYKLKAADADAFKAACDEVGESQAAAITRLMASYVADYKAFEFDPDAKQCHAASTGCWLCRLKARLRKGKAPG